MLWRASKASFFSHSRVKYYDICHITNRITGFSVRTSLQEMYTILILLPWMEETLAKEMG